MVTARVSVEGIPRTKAALRKKGKSIKNSMVRNLWIAGLLISNEAKQKAPVDKGHLQASIHVEVKSNNEVQIKDKVSYGIHQEFGTSKMRAHPFMRPAVASKRAQVIRLFSRGVKIATKA